MTSHIIPNLSILFCVRNMTIRTLSLFQYLYTNNLSDIISGQKKGLSLQRSTVVAVAAAVVVIAHNILSLDECTTLNHLQNPKRMLYLLDENRFFPKTFSMPMSHFSRILHSRYFILLQYYDGIFFSLHNHINIQIVQFYFF